VILPSRRHIKKRLDDFQAWAQDDPKIVRRVPKYKWEYIAIHPMADERRWLRKLRMSPENCTGVDAYWKVE
jgi:uroporphyrinogen-III decarboxylase